MWEELESESDTELIVNTGGIDFAPRNSDNMKKLLSVCETNKIPYNILDSTSVSETFPGFSVPNNYDVVHTKKAGKN